MPTYSNANNTNVQYGQVAGGKKESYKKDNTIDYEGMIGAFDVLYVRFCQKFADRAEPTTENMILLNQAYKNIKVTNPKT